MTLIGHGFQSFGGAFQGGHIQSVPFGATFQSDDRYSMVSYYIGYQILNDDQIEKEVIPESISLYPNPVVEFATLNIDTERIEILDLNGKVLNEYYRVRKGERINLNRFSDGMYIARLTLSEGNQPVKIVKLNKSTI